MPRTFTLIALVLVCAVSAAASEAGHGDGDPNLVFKLVNFGILVVGLGYLFVKLLFPIFRSQQRQILEGMAQASRRAEAAAKQAADVDRRMGGLQKEVEKLRAEAHDELVAERARVEEETAGQVAKMEHAATVEIDAALIAAKQELKAFSARMALDLAAKKAEAKMNDAVQADLVSRFASHLASRGVEKN